MKRYRNREDAGRRLAEEIAPSYPDNPDLVVLGLARGGVAVAVELAERLHAPMDIFVMRKLGVPGHPEMAMGALASGGVRVLNKYIIAYLDISEEVLETVTDAEKKKLNHREITYRGMAPPLNLAGKTVILVDDGLATGATMRAAVHAVRARMAARVVVAVPVAAPDSLESIAQEADDVVCPAAPQEFHAVGQWYEQFGQLSDDDVRNLLLRTGTAQISSGTARE